MNNLPDGVDVDNRVVTSTWTEGAIGYGQIATRAGQDVTGVLRMSSGTPPLGAIVRRMKAIYRLGWWPMKAASGSAPLSQNSSFA